MAIGGARDIDERAVSRLSNENYKSTIYNMDLSAVAVLDLLDGEGSVPSWVAYLALGLSVGMVASAMSHCLLGRCLFSSSRLVSWLVLDGTGCRTCWSSACCIVAALAEDGWISLISF